jgi:hypothetical protein
VICNQEFQTPSSRKAERSKVVGSWRISIVDHVGGEVLEIQRSEFWEVRNLSAVGLASHEMTKRNIYIYIYIYIFPETLKDNSSGPNRVSGLRESRDRVACQRNSRNRKREKA